MPSAETMMDAYEARIRHVRDRRNVGLEEESRVGKVWLALFDLVNADRKEG